MKREPLFHYDTAADTIWVRSDIWPVVNALRFLFWGSVIASWAVLLLALAFAGHK